MYNPVDTDSVISRLIIIQALPCHALKSINIIAIILLLYPWCRLAKHVIALTLDHIEQIKAFSGRDSLFELIRAHDLRSIVKDLVSRIIVSTRRYERTFGTSLVDKQLSLHVNGTFLKFLETLFLQHLPNACLGDTLVVFDHISLVLVKPVAEARNESPVMVLERR